MATQTAATQVNVPAIRVSGKQWKVQKAPTVRTKLSKALRSKFYRLESILTQGTFESRLEDKKRQKETKLQEEALRAEQAAERERKANIIREKREKKAEKERYEKLKNKMHQKTVDRMRRREKRNKLVKER